MGFDETEQLAIEAVLRLKSAEAARYMEQTKQGVIIQCTKTYSMTLSSFIFFSYFHLEDCVPVEEIILPPLSLEDEKAETLARTCINCLESAVFAGSTEKFLRHMCFLHLFYFS